MRLFPFLPVLLSIAAAASQTLAYRPLSDEFDELPADARPVTTKVTPNFGDTIFLPAGSPRGFVFRVHEGEYVTVSAGSYAFTSVVDLYEAHGGQLVKIAHENAPVASVTAVVNQPVAHDAVWLAVVSSVNGRGSGSVTVGIRLGSD